MLSYLNQMLVWFMAGGFVGLFTALTILLYALNEEHLKTVYRLDLELGDMARYRNYKGFNKPKNKAKEMLLAYRGRFSNTRRKYYD